jgi:hypothetical protein
MKMSGQIVRQMNQMAEAEVRAAFRAYCRQALGTAERILGEEIATPEKTLPLLKQAFDKGIDANALGQMIAQSAT